MEKKQFEESIEDACGKVELLQSQLRIDTIPITATIIKDTVKEFIEAAHFIENAPISFFYEKEIGLFNMYMWHVRDSVLDIMKLWLRRNTGKDRQGNHIVKVGQDDPIMNGCVSIIKAIRRAALKTGTTIIPPTSSDDVITIKIKKAEQAKHDPELKRIFKGNTEELNKFLGICIYAPDGTTVKREALKLGKNQIIFENDIPGNLYERLNYYELINIAHSTWRGGNKKNLMK